MATQARTGQTDRLETDTPPLVFPFADLDRAALPVAGGKAANLGELMRAGLPVPPGFCVTTAAYALVAAGQGRAGLDATLSELAATRADDLPRLAELAAAARAALLAAPVPSAVEGAIVAAYQALGDGEPAPVAVRSSATA